MTEPAEASRRLLALRDRLSALHAELRGVENEIAQCVQDLAAATGTQPAALFPNDSTATRVLMVLHEHADRTFAPSDVAERLGLQVEADRANVRNHLFRLARAGRAERVGHGRYRAVRQG